MASAAYIARLSDTSSLLGRLLLIVAGVVFIVVGHAGDYMQIRYRQSLSISGSSVNSLIFPVFRWLSASMHCLQSNMEMAAFVLTSGIRYGHCGANDMHDMPRQTQGKEAAEAS